MKNLLTFILCITGISVQSQPRWYYVIQPGGAWATIGEFDTLEGALKRVGSGSSEFVKNHTAIISTEAPVKGGLVEWQFDPEKHQRAGTVAQVNKLTKPTAPPMPTLPISKPAVKARVTPVIAPSPVRGSTTVSVSSGPPGTPVPAWWGWGKEGHLWDVETSIMVTDAFGVLFDVQSNLTYRAWCAGNLNGPWHEYPMSTNVQPALVNGQWAHCLPITPTSQRFYQITQTP